MDPFSGVTALVPIALMLFNASHKLKGFLRELRNAPDDVHQFMNEMIFYSKFLERFHNTMHESGPSLQPDEDAERQELVEHVVDQATVVMKGVEVIIPIFEAVHSDKNLSSTNFMTRLKLYSKKSEVAHLRRCLAEAKGTAQLLSGFANNNETKPAPAESKQAKSPVRESTTATNQSLGGASVTCRYWTCVGNGFGNRR
ncbi:hypothetical protein PG985_007333 [Apiospora marii]|uniref:Uncharacterized protein n=1 Tax=Apiospora marii TaxID=335849 RepID=A0ABR1SNW5_9PEZI